MASDPATVMAAAEKADPSMEEKPVRSPLSKSPFIIRQSSLAWPQEAALKAKTGIIKARRRDISRCPPGR